MKTLSTLAVGLLCSTAVTAQVGIGTLSPNTKSVLELSSTSKGLLLPRMTSVERTSMNLSAADAGMMVYQTTIPKGTYTWDGGSWAYYAPIEAGTVNGYTLRWDGNKWTQASNLFNNGSAIILGTITSANYQFQIHANATPYTRFQLTNNFTGSLYNDGLILGIGNTSSQGIAHLIQQENKPLWFGTNGIERMRIDSAGRVGINTDNPSATLDVAGTVKLGETGSTIDGIMHANIEIDPPLIDSDAEWTATISFPDAAEDAAVYVSPGSSMDHIMIGYSRVSSPGNIDIKLMNMGPPVDMGAIMLHIAVIQ